MQFKALILDLDGTTIPNALEGRPSQRVKDSISKAQKKLKVCIATGRSIESCGKILEELEIKNPCVITGGTEIYNPVTKDILWEKKLSVEQLGRIMNVCSDYPYKIYFADETPGWPAARIEVTNPEKIVYIESVTPQDTHILLEELLRIDDTNAVEVGSWTPGMFDIHVTHKEATKKHALEILLSMIQVDKSEVIAIGDSKNDLPLFEIAGYKVAMGNAVEELKAKADEITDDVENDGVAKIIESKIL